ncbi:hypothetical protein PybrP1_011403 [[Pythium] brassicae (nom. inval.)]|nr:hypothetical protein PybrP1_011403 [[Pythium] brassicae (nom. inval.)]
MDRSGLTFLAKLDEQAERYDDMADRMMILSNSVDDELTVEERTLLAVAYKNVIGARRASWRVVSAIENKGRLGGDSVAAASSIKAYRLKIERELTELCGDMLATVDKHLIPKASSGEGRVFFYKTKGDYLRYAAEIQVGDERDESARQALEAYKTSLAIAVAELTPTHPIRLGLALNFSVFYYDILHSVEQACGLARRAFDDAIADLDTLADDSYRDSTLIMQLLRDNITLWTSEADDDDEGDKPDN